MYIRLICTYSETFRFQCVKIEYEVYNNILHRNSKQILSKPTWWNPTLITIHWQQHYSTNKNNIWYILSASVIL